MQFRIRIAMEVERPAEELHDTTQAATELVYRGGKWQGSCHEPPLVTELCDNLEEALVAIAKEIIRDSANAPLG